MSKTRIACLVVSTIMTSALALATPAHASLTTIDGDKNWGIAPQSSVRTETVAARVVEIPKRLAASTA